MIRLVMLQINKYKPRLTLFSVIKNGDWFYIFQMLSPQLIRFLSILFIILSTPNKLWRSLFFLLP